MSKQPDSVIVIGAGPAGSVAATLLARAGVPVTLVEQHRFPRDKVCGECLSSLGIDVLERIGLSIEGARLNRAAIHAPNGSTVELRLPRPMLGISRRRFDAQLLALAQKSGATIRQPARCEGIDEESVLLRDLATNCVERIAASTMLIADGKSHVLTKRDLGVKAHFRNVEGPGDAIELFGVAGTYGGLAPVEDANTWNASFSVPASRVAQHRGNLDALFEQIVLENRALRERMRRAERCSDWLAAPLPRFGVRRIESDRIIPIGNAAAAIEPIGGEGMGLAMRSAELAVESILRGESARILEQRYQNLWSRRGLACRVVAQLVSNPTICKWIIGGIDDGNAMANQVMRWIGKSPTTAVNSAA